MKPQNAKVGIRGRQLPRVDIANEVTIRFEAGSIVGSGENISLQGVFFTADGSLPVTVQVAGRGEARGKLVRLESMGDGRIGIAVRFDEPAPALMPDS